MFIIAITFNFEKAATKAVARFAVTEVRQPLLAEGDATVVGP